MNPFLQIAPQDKSCEYLQNIFGSMNGMVCHSQNADISISILGTMFQTFNSIVLAIAALLVLYVTVVGVIQTAHEGEFMGKKWNNIWIPLRMVFGIAFLVPTGSGYSVLQLVIMWVIVQGVAAADTLWTTTLGYVNVIGSPYGQMNLPSIGSNHQIQNLFQGLVCDATTRLVPFASYGKDPTSAGGPYYCAASNTNKVFCSSASPTTADFKSVTTRCSGNTCTMNMGPSGNCGKLTYCNETALCSGENAQSLKCAVCKKQTIVLGQIVNTLANIGAQFAQADYDYRDFYVNSDTRKNPKWTWINNYCSSKSILPDNCCIYQNSVMGFIIPRPPGTTSCAASSDPTNFPSPNALTSGKETDPQSASVEAAQALYLPFGIPAISSQDGGTKFLATSSGYYLTEIQKTVQEWLAAQGRETTLTGGLEDAKRVGWIFAGGYYYEIARMSDNNVKESLPTFVANVGDSASTGLNRYRNNISAANALIVAASRSEDQEGSVFGGNTPISVLGSTMDSASQSINSAMSTAVGESTTNISFSSGGDTGGPDPITQLINTGNVLLSIPVILWPILIAITTSVSVVGYISVFALGTGVINPAGPTYSNVMALLIMPALYGLMGILISLGGLLGIYVPLIPYIIFTLGAIGWLISTIEAMVAGPLVALGIISPSGHHEILGKAEPALMLIFNVFLRPSLMIFGLIAAMLLAKVVIGMINYTFWTLAIHNIRPYGILQMVLVLSAYVTFVVSVLNKCFAAIYLIPQQVMSWIGGQGAQYGEAEAVGEMKSGVSSAGERTSGAYAASEGRTSAAAKHREKLAGKAAAEATSEKTELKGGKKK